MKKYVLICLTVLLVCCLAAGCGKTASQDTQATQDILPTLVPEAGSDSAPADSGATVEDPAEPGETGQPTADGAGNATGEPDEAPAEQGETGSSTSEAEGSTAGEPGAAPEEPALDLQWDHTWRSEQETMIRELILRYDGSEFLLRCGEPDSEYYYWIHGTWTLKEDNLHLEGVETDELGNPLPEKEVVEGDYTVALEEGALVLTSLGPNNIMLEETGASIVYQLRSSEETGD